MYPRFTQCDSDVFTIVTENSFQYHKYVFGEAWIQLVRYTWLLWKDGDSILLLGEVSILGGTFCGLS